MRQQISIDPERKADPKGWRTIRHFAYVDRPFRDVRRAMAAAPQRMLASPSGSTDGEAEPRAELRVRRARLDLTREVRMVLGDVEIGVRSASLPIRWEDATHPELFPILDAVLEVEPVPAGRHAMTQLGLLGRYRPPLGRLGGLADNLAGHRIVAESVERFLDDLVDRFQATLPVAETEPDLDDSPAGGTAREIPGQRRIALPVDGLDSLPGGAAGLALRLLSEPGVLDATVNPASGLAVIDYDGSTTGVAQLLHLLEAEDE